MIKLWRVLSVSIVLAVCLGLLLVPVAVPGVALASDSVTISIESATTYALPSGSFTIDAVINNPLGKEVAMHGICLNFDPAYFTVDSVSLVNFTSDMGPATIDNVNGTVDYSPGMTTGTSINKTTIISARINCTAKSLEGISTVSWVYKTTPPPPRTTCVTYASIDYLEYGNMSLMLNGTVTIGDIFNLTVTSDGCCPITVGSLGTVAANSNDTFIVPCSSGVTLTAGTSACCVFDNWTVDGNFTSGNPVNVNGTANTTHNATATCSVPEYNLTMAVTGNGTTTPSGTSSHPCGDVVNINATADPGWQFVNWTGDLIGSTNPTTITMDGDKNVTANFVEQFTLTMAVTGNGNTTPAVGNHTYNNGTVVPINATPGSGWHFVNWTTTGNISEIANATAVSTTVTVDKNKTVTATFAINRYNLTINSTIGGNVTTPGEGVQGLYDHGTVVDLNATPDADYAFLGWSGNVSTIGDVNSSNTNITMYGNYSIMAHFGPHDFSARPISLTFTTDEGENPPSKTLEICNTGNGTLNWSLKDNAAWLSENPTSGSLAEDECEDVTVSVDVAGMKAGDYSATITITGSPELEVPVSLHIVSAMPELPAAPAKLSASGLSISPQQVEPGQEVTISINVANTGGETGSYNAILYINGVVEDSQSVSVAPGMTKNVIFAVTKSDAGVYDVSIAGQSGQFEVVHTGWFAGGLGTGGIVAIVVIVIVLILALFFVLRGTRREV